MPWLELGNSTHRVRPLIKVLNTPSLRLLILHQDPKVFSNAVLAQTSEMTRLAEQKLAAAAVPFAKLFYPYKKAAVVTAVITVGFSIYGWFWYRSTTLTYGSPDGILTAKAQVALQVVKTDLLAMAVLVRLSFRLHSNQQALTCAEEGWVISYRGGPRSCQMGRVTLRNPCILLFRSLDS